MDPTCFPESNYGIMMFSPVMNHSVRRISEQAYRLFVISRLENGIRMARTGKSKKGIEHFV